MLAETVIIYLWHLCLVNYVSRKSRREGTLEETTVEVVPEDLVKNALVVGGVEGVVAVEG